MQKLVEFCDKELVPLGFGTASMKDAAPHEYKAGISKSTFCFGLPACARELLRLAGRFAGRFAGHIDSSWMSVSLRFGTASMKDAAPQKYKEGISTLTSWFLSKASRRK